MQTMLTFYRDLLGLRLTKQSYHFAVRGLKPSPAWHNPRPTWSFWKHPLDQGSNLSVTEPQIVLRPTGLSNPNTKGLRHIALRVTNLDVLVAALRRSGVEMLSEVQQVPAAQVD